MKKTKEYVCSNCGAVSAKWSGKCASCEEWNTISENDIVEISPIKSKNKLTGTFGILSDPKAVKLRDIEFSDSLRVKTGVGEFDRVLGGGLVSGSVVLLSGAPGIGKSTLLLQMCRTLNSSTKILYVSGEESASQLKLRANRLNVTGDNISILCETNIAKIIPECNTLLPDVIIIDSIQTLYDEDSPSVPGTVTQVKQTSLRLISYAKENSVPVIIVGHINKDGAVAGPKVLEHMVDAVLYFEGDKNQSHRLVRAVKNRFGSTNEIGVFEMGDEGLNEIANPSEFILEQRPKGVSGSCAVSILEGTRPIIAEIQALCASTTFPAPRRMASGFDYNRINLIIAVIEKRLGIRFSNHDVYINIAGGMKITDSSCDAAAAAALISSLKDIATDESLIIIGEMGLSGEIRSVMGLEQRINESVRLGFTRIAIPHRAKVNEKSKIYKNVELIRLRTVYDILKLLG